MTVSLQPDDRDGDSQDVSRRTWLAAERTWLAWWRTGLAASGGALAVGRVLPTLAGGEHWPFRLLGLGYGTLAVAVLVIGGARQQRTAAALRRGSYDELATSLVAWLTGVAVALSVATLAVVAVSL